ncbi:hypothetical protein ACVIJ6_007135 [Bradyrhizobium sp. USDA 4369]
MLSLTASAIYGSLDTGMVRCNEMTMVQNQLNAG